MGVPGSDARCPQLLWDYQPNHPRDRGHWNLIIDQGENQVEKQSILVRLTRSQWAILRVLIGNSGSVITSRQLIEKALRRDGLHDVHSLHKFIARLREKLEPNSRQPRRIPLDRGRGYRLDGPDSSWPVIIHPDGIFFGHAP